MFEHQVNPETITGGIPGGGGLDGKYAVYFPVLEGHQVPDPFDRLTVLMAPPPRSHMHVAQCEF